MSELRVSDRPDTRSSFVSRTFSEENGVSSKIVYHRKSGERSCSSTEGEPRNKTLRKILSVFPLPWLVGDIIVNEGPST